MESLSFGLRLCLPFKQTKIYKMILSNLNEVLKVVVRFELRNTMCTSAVSDLLLLFLLLVSSTLIQSNISSVFTSWESGHATVYGSSNSLTTASATYAACGYRNLDSQAALSTALFNEPLSGGACFEIKCANDSQCGHPHSPSIVVTARNVCHSNNSPPQCNSPGPHFQLAMPTFRRIAQYPAYNASVAFRRVPCQTEGGIKFNITRFDDMIQVLISNVAGAGNIVKVSVKGSDSGWLHMRHGCRNWGKYWQLDANLTGQALSFRVTGSDGRTLTSYNIAPANWKFGQSFVGNNFRV